MDLQRLAIGECVYFATELSKGRNEILVHEYLENVWPTGENGRIRFTHRRVKDLNAYLLGYKD